MKRLAVAAVVILTAGGVANAKEPTFADIKEGLRICQQMPPIGKLACYEGVARIALGARKAGIRLKTPALGWETRLDNDPMTDDSFVTVGRRSLSEYGGGQAVIGIGCKNKKMVFLAVVWPSGLKASGSADIYFRIDKQALFKKSVQIEQNVTRLFEGSAKDLVSKLLAGSRLYAETVSYLDQRMLVGFDLTGLEDAIKPLRKACGW